MAKIKVLLSIPKETRTELVRSGLLPLMCERDVRMVKDFHALRNDGETKNECYRQIGSRYKLTPSRVRQVIDNYTK